MRTLRISLFCGGSYVSGTEIMALTAVRGLLERGYKVFCIVNGWNNGDFTQRLERLGVPYQPVYLGKLTGTLQPKYMWWTVNALLHLPGAWLACWRHFEHFSPDVVLLYNRDPILLIHPLLRNQQSVYYVHEAPDVTKKAMRLHRIIDSRIGTYIAVSQHVQKRLVDLGIKGDKTIVVGNGIEVEPLVSLKHVNYETARPVVIGIVGQVGAWKGHDDLIEALALLEERSARFQCHVFGKGDDAYVRQLQRKIDAYGLTEKITWRGFVQDVSAIYEELDICVVSSRFEEPFGLVAVEAGASGLPVVATRTGGLREIVRDGETGFLVDPCSPDQLADCLQRLIDSPQLRARMGGSARDHVLAHFTSEKMLDGIEAVCRQVATRT